MFVIRATVKLRKHWKILRPAEDAESTCILGAFYANVVSTGRRRMLLGVFERTFLPVVLPLAQLAQTLPALRSAVHDMLRSWEVPATVAETALPETSVVVVTPTASRVVLGVLNDFARLVQFDSPREDTRTQVAFLGDTPLTPLDMECPKQATQALLRKPELYVVRKT